MTNTTWKRGNIAITIGVSNSDTMTIQRADVIKAWVNKPFAVHYNRSSKLWHVTHINTGLIVARFSTRYNAQQFAADIRDITSWDAITIESFREYQEEIREKIQEYMDKWYAFRTYHYGLSNTTTVVYE